MSEPKNFLNTEAVSGWSREHHFGTGYCLLRPGTARGSRGQRVFGESRLLLKATEAELMVILTRQIWRNARYIMTRRRNPVEIKFDRILIPTFKNDKPWPSVNEVFGKHASEFEL